MRDAGGTSQLFCLLDLPTGPMLRHLGQRPKLLARLESLFLLTIQSHSPGSLEHARDMYQDIVVLPEPNRVTWRTLGGLLGLR